MSLVEADSEVAGDTYLARVAFGGVWAVETLPERTHTMAALKRRLPRSRPLQVHYERWESIQQEERQLDDLVLPLELPSVGLGLWKAQKAGEAKGAVIAALKAG